MANGEPSNHSPISSAQDGGLIRPLRLPCSQRAGVFLSSQFAFAEDKLCLRQSGIRGEEHSQPVSGHMYTSSALPLPQRCWPSSKVRRATCVARLLCMPTSSPTQSAGGHLQTSSTAAGSSALPTTVTGLSRTSRSAYLQSQPEAREGCRGSVGWGGARQAGLLCGCNTNMCRLLCHVCAAAHMGGNRS